jgi:hypothetical protein
VEETKMTKNTLVGVGVVAQIFGFSVSWVKLNEPKLNLVPVMSDAGHRRYDLDAVLTAHTEFEARQGRRQ